MLWILIGIIISLLPTQVLIVENMYTSQVYVVDRFSPSDQFTVEWIHSVELTPWAEVFSVTNTEDILLLKTRFKAFGAGVPDIEATQVYNENGFVVYDGIHQLIAELTYGISPVSRHTLTVKGKVYPLYDMLPEDTGVRLRFGKRPLIMSFIY